MPVAGTDSRSNPNDQIAHAANVLKRSERLRNVFVTVCRGGKKPKTVAQIMRTTGYGQIAVLQLAGRLADQQLIHKMRSNGQTLYEKDRFYAANRTKVIRLATSPKKLRELPTKYSPRQSTNPSIIRIAVSGAKIQIKETTCDDFDQFAKIKKIKTAPARLISEKSFKAGIAKLLGETGRFVDWGGEAPRRLGGSS